MSLNTNLNNLHIKKQTYEFDFLTFNVHNTDI